MRQPLFGSPCPNNCSGRGVCNRELGECRCSLGYQGRSSRLSHKGEGEGEGEGGSPALHVAITRMDGGESDVASCR